MKKVLFFLLLSYQAAAQCDQYEVKGQFYWKPWRFSGFTMGSGTIESAPVEPNPRVHPDFMLFFGDEIWKRVDCGPNSQPCHRWNGHEWVYDECGCYQSTGCKKIEQCVSEIGIITVPIKRPQA